MGASGRPALKLSTVCRPPSSCALFPPLKMKQQQEQEKLVRAGLLLLPQCVCSFTRDLGGLKSLGIQLNLSS